MLNYISTGVIILFSAISVYLYSMMPPQMLTHWNFYGQADGYSDKVWGMFLLPAVTLAIFLLAFCFSKYSSHKKKIKKFVKYYDGLVLSLVLFFNYLFSLVLLNNLGYSVNMNRFVPIGLGLLIFYFGAVFLQSKHDWFLSGSSKIFSETEWNKISYLGGILLMVSGGVNILGSWWPRQALFFVLIPVVIAGLITIIYAVPFLGKKKRRT